MSTGIEAAGLSDTQRQIVDLAREFCRGRIEPYAADWDTRRHFPRDVIDEMGKLGFLGALAPEGDEGMGLDAVSYCLALEELAAADAGVALVVSTHNAAPTTLLVRHGSPLQRDRWLKPMARGTVLAALAVAEPDAGSDAAAVSTRAVRDGASEGWVLDGTKAWVSHGAAADLVLVLARSAGGISAFLVPADGPGYGAGTESDTMGLRSSGTVPVTLEGVRLPADHLLGEEGQGLAYLGAAADVARLGCAVIGVGVARRALEHAVAYCGERRQFGRSLREFEAVQFKLAEMATRVEAARALAHSAALRHDRGEDALVQASMAKLFAAETAMWVTTQAVQLFGGYGYMRDFPVEKLFRDAKGLEILEGTSEMQRLAVAQGLTGDYHQASPSTVRHDLG